MNRNHQSDGATASSRRQVIRWGLQRAAGLLAAYPLLAAHPLLAGDLVNQLRPDQVPGKAGARVKVRSVIQIFLWGGMSYVDTWDPKPAAGYNYMGTLSSVIQTSVPGIQIGGLFPKLAEQADKFSLIRGITHRNNGHETVAYPMQTGHTPGERLAYPSVRVVFSLFKSPEHKGVIPPYVVLTQAQGRFSEEGFLGPRFTPFAMGGDPNAPRFKVEGVIARGITDNRQKAHRKLLTGLNMMGHAMAARQELSDAEEAKKQAYELILGSSREVFDLSKEKPDPRGRYGRHQFGQDCLVARRLVEKGVPYIYQLGGIDASARLPHPMGLEAHVLPSISEGVKSAGLLTEIM